MEHHFVVSDRVLATVKGFEPWPATVDNVVSEPNKQNETYYIRFDGSYKSVPINVRSLKRLKPCDEQRWSWMCVDERWHEARKRIEVVEGLYITIDNDGDYIPPTLWNFVAADCEYEAVSDPDKATLHLRRVAHNAKVRYSELQSKFEYHKKQNEVRWRTKDDTEDFLLVDESPKKSEECFQPITVIRFRCPKCSKKYKTRMALKKHMELNSECHVSKAPTPEAPVAPAAPVAFVAPAPLHRPQQCPKCFSLYPNQELLLKHMAVHQKVSPAKKKAGLREHLRQAMTTTRGRVGSYNPKSKGGERSTKVAPPERKARKISSPVESEEDASLSDEDSWKECSSCQSRKCYCRRKPVIHCREVHNKREQERRSQMRHEFEQLAEILGVADSGRSKGVILVRAKQEILDLEANRTKLEHTLNDLKDMNVRLVSREYQLR